MVSVAISGKRSLAFGVVLATVAKSRDRPSATNGIDNTDMEPLEINPAATLQRVRIVLP
jgi:hypothetical protein